MRENKFLISLITVMLVSLLLASLIGAIAHKKRSNNPTNETPNTEQTEVIDNTENNETENNQKKLSFYSKEDINNLVVGQCNNTSTCTFINDYICKNDNCRVISTSKNYALIRDGDLVLSNIRYKDNTSLTYLSLNTNKVTLVENNNQIYGMIIEENNKYGFYSFSNRKYTIGFDSYQIYPVEPYEGNWTLDGLIVIDFDKDYYKILDYSGNGLKYEQYDLQTKLSVLEGTNLRYFTTHISTNTEKYIFKPDGNLISYDGIIDTESIKVENGKLNIYSGSSLVASYDKDGNRL